MSALPRYSIRHNINESAHLVILGAGASRAAFPKGDTHGMRLPVMMDLVDLLGLKPLLDSEGVRQEGRNFEDVYEELAGKRAGSSVLQNVQEIVYQYFDQLDMPAEVTLYDRLLLSLRRKDLIATFNWDPFLVRAYQRNMHLGELPVLVFLHGSVAIVACNDCKRMDFKPSTCGGCGRPMKQVSLLYPISQKAYQSGDPFIRGQWARLEAVLDQAYFLTIFGYSAPSSDVEAKRLMKEAWSRNERRDLAQIELINTSHRRKLVRSWQEFIVGHHYHIGRLFSHSSLSHYPRRSCEALAWATLQNDPWHDRPMPRTKNLKKLQEWIRPLIEEEVAYRERREPLSRFT